MANYHKHGIMDSIFKDGMPAALISGIKKNVGYWFNRC